MRYSAMKKRKKKQIRVLETANLVAKHAHTFNKAVVFKDKTKYQRKAKHSKLDAFFIIWRREIKKVSSDAICQ